MTTIQVWDRNVLKSFLERIETDERGNVNQRDEISGNTALIYATNINHQSAVRRLLALGADVTMRATKTHTTHTALTTACHKGHSKIVKALLAHPGINMNQKVSKGWTALMYAYDNVPIVRLLLAAGANPNLTNNQGETAFMRSFMDANVAQILLGAGTDVNVTDQMGETALYIPFPPDIMRAILKAGANVNHQSYSGCTPLICAANRDNYNHVSILLAAGADPTIRASNGKDALQYARSAPVYNLIQDYLTHRASLKFALAVGRHPVLNADVLSHIGTFLGYSPMPGQQTVRDMILSVQRIHHT